MTTAVERLALAEALDLHKRRVDEAYKSLRTTREAHEAAESEYERRVAQKQAFERSIKDNTP